MIVITRKKRQQIVVNGNVVITLVKVKGNLALIGIEAPRDVPIVRMEKTGRTKEER